MNIAIHNAKANNTIIALVVIIVLQVTLLFAMSYSKQEYHIDEIYSYIISNSHNADRISNSDDVWGKWVKGEDFNQFVAVQTNEGFSYDRAYYNTSMDCHPPLYYWTLHTVSSFFPNIFSKWFGLALNILLFIIADIFLYILAAKLIKSKWLKLLPVVLYGFSIFAIDTVTFIRMYMLLTVFTLWLTYLFTKIFHDGLNAKRLFALLFVTYCGAMTQYYFIIFAFWATSIFCTYLLIKKQIKQMFCVATAEAIGVGALLITFPYVIRHVTGTSTNNVGNEVMKNFFNFKLWISQSVSLIKHVLLDISSNVFLIFIVLAIILIIIFTAIAHKKLKRDQFKISNNTLSIEILLTLVTTFFSVTFIGGEYVYVRYIYYIIPLIYLMVVVILDVIFINAQKLQCIIMIVLTIFSIINASIFIKTQEPEYIYEKKAIENQEVVQASDHLIVAMYKRSTAIPTGNFTVIKNYKNVYMDTIENLNNANVLKKCLQEKQKCTVYIPTDRYWLKVDNTPQETIDKLTENMPEVVSYKISKAALGEYYMVQLK